MASKFKIYANKSNTNHLLLHQMCTCKSLKQSQKSPYMVVKFIILNKNNYSIDNISCI